MKYNLIRITEGETTVLETDTDLQYLERERTTLINEADNSMNLFRITVDPDEIRHALSLCPSLNGRTFDNSANWDQDFGEYITSGPDWSSGIPEDTPEYEEAKNYSDEVEASICRAFKHETICVQALLSTMQSVIRNGSTMASDYLANAIEAAEAAYREELQWGDAPSYGPLCRFLSGS